MTCGIEMFSFFTAKRNTYWGCCCFNMKLIAKMGKKKKRQVIWHYESGKVDRGNLQNWGFRAKEIPSEGCNC